MTATYNHYIIDLYNRMGHIGGIRMETHLLLSEHPYFSENPIFLLMPMEEKYKPDIKLGIGKENLAVPFSFVSNLERGAIHDYRFPCTLQQ